MEDDLYEGEIPYDLGPRRSSRVRVENIPFTLEVCFSHYFLFPRFYLPCFISIFRDRDHDIQGLGGDQIKGQFFWNWQYHLNSRWRKGFSFIFEHIERDIVISTFPLILIRCFAFFLCWFEQCFVMLTLWQWRDFLFECLNEQLGVPWFQYPFIIFFSQLWFHHVRMVSNQRNWKCVVVDVLHLIFMKRYHRAIFFQFLIPLNISTYLS